MGMSTGGPAQEDVRFTLRISKVTSAIIITHKATVTLTGTYADLEVGYSKVLVHNLLLGWWGIPFGLIWTPMALVRNKNALAKLREMAAGRV